MSEAIDNLTKMDVCDLLTSLVGATLFDNNTAPYISQISNRFQHLREQNRVLWEAAQQAMDLIHEDIVQGDKAGRRLKAEAILWNALTATSQPGGEG